MVKKQTGRGFGNKAIIQNPPNNVKSKKMIARKNNSIEKLNRWEGVGITLLKNVMAGRPFYRGKNKV